jgi:hypothetical protein
MRYMWIAACLAAILLATGPISADQKQRVNPDWSAEYLKTTEVGEHIFYKPHGGEAIYPWCIRAGLFSTGRMPSHLTGAPWPAGTRARGSGGQPGERTSRKSC